MPINCKKCDRVFRDTYDLQRHIMRKTPCDPVKSESNPKKSLSRHCDKIIADTGSGPSTDLELVVVDEHLSMLDNKCSYCDKLFSTSSNLARHIKSTCKIKKQQDEDKEIIFQNLLLRIEAVEQDNKKLHKKNEKLDRKNERLERKITYSGKNINNGTINNTTNTGIVNNTINIIAFGKEDISHITNKEWMRIINRQYRSIEDLVVKTHFDKNKPENHNIYISNIKSKYIMVHDGKNWCIKDKRDTIDDLYDEKAYIIFNKVDELNSQGVGLPFKIVDKYNEIKTDYDEEKIRAALIKDIELILYNKRDIPIYSKRCREEVS